MLNRTEIEAKLEEKKQQIAAAKLKAEEESRIAREKIAKEREEARNHRIAEIVSAIEKMLIRAFEEGKESISFYDDDWFNSEGERNRRHGDIVWCLEKEEDGITEQVLSAIKEAGWNIEQTGNGGITIS